MDKKNSNSIHLDSKYPKISKYLQKSGLVEQLDWQEWDINKLVRFIRNNNIRFEGEECGYLKFFKVKGKRYIKYVPEKICIENLDLELVKKNEACYNNSRKEE